MSDRKDEPSVYTIPPNYKEAGSLFGGMLKMRNSIEAGILVFLISNCVLKTGLSLYGKIIALCLTALPVGLFAIIGINGESLFSFILIFFAFVEKRRYVGVKPKDRSAKPESRRRNKAQKKEKLPNANANIIVRKNDKLVNNAYIKTINQAAGYLPIKTIKDGVICTKDNRYVKFIEIEPINFLLRNAREQRNIIYSFISFLKISPVKLQFKVITKRADINKHLASIHRDICTETDENCRILQKDYEQLIRRIGSKEAITRRFLLIFEYEPGYGSHAKNIEAEAVSQLKTVVQTAQNYLRQCGNEVVIPENEDEFISETLYSLLNRNTSAESSFQNHVSDVVKKYVEAHGEVDTINEIPTTEFFAPGSIDFTHGSYVVIDGVYHAYLMIPSEGFKPYVLAGWTSLLVNAGEGIDMDLFKTKEPKDRIQQKLGQQIRINRSRINDASDTNTDYDDLGGAIRSGYFLKQGLSNNEDFYYINVLLTITAHSVDELEWRINEMKKLMLSQDLDIYKCVYREEMAFLSALPLLSLNKYLYQRTKRNALTLGAASCYPFTSYEMCDDNGILLGVNRHNNSLIIIDIFNSRIYKNANITVLGTCGSGKTFTIQLIALRMRMKNIQVFIISPLKGHEFYRACKNIGGEFIQISPASPHCINIMEIRKTDSISHELIDETVIEKSKLAAKIQSLHVFFSLLIPDMSHEERQLLDDAMVKTYEQKDINHDNESLYSSDGVTYREMPVLGDLHAILSKGKNTKRLANILNRLVHGSAKSFNQQTNVDLDNKYTVLDISELTGDLLTVGMFVALDYVWDKVKEDRTKEKTIILDELWKLIGSSSNKLAADYVLEIFKIIRGYGGSAIGATQDINDYFALDDGKYGKGIINNSKTKIVLNLEDEEAQRVQSILRLSETEVMAITHFERGNGLISTNNNNVTVEMKSSRLELELITSDRRELKELMEKKKIEKNL